MPLNVLGGPLSFEAEIKAGQFEAVLNRIENRIQGLTTTANKEAGAIDNLVRRTVAGIGSFALLAGAGNFVADMVRIRGEFQQLEVAFKTMLGSKEKADQLLKDVTEFAATTPFELKEVAGAAKQLLAFGISADKIKETLRSLGDVAAGLGQPLGEIAYLFGTIKTQGVAMTIDVRQFAQRGIPIYEALSKVLGVATEKVGELVTAGKVGFPEIEAAFQSLTGEGSKFGGLMEAQSKTLAGLQSNLADAVQQMFNDLGKSQEGVFADIIRTTTSLVKNYDKVIDVLKIIGITYGTYRAALIATNVIEKVSIIIQNAHVAAMGRLTALQKIQAVQTVIVNRVTAILNRTMLANPYVAVAVAVAALVSAMVLLGNSTSAAERAQEAFNARQQEQKERVDELRNRTSELVAIIEDETASRFQQVRAFKELQQLLPGVLSNMDLLGFKTLTAEDRQRRFNEAIDKNSLAELQQDIKDTESEISRLNEAIDSVLEAAESTAQAEFFVDQLEKAENLLAKYKAELEKVKQAQFEANTPIEQQIVHYEKIKEQLIAQKGELEKARDKMEQMTGSAFLFTQTLEGIDLRNVNTQLNEILKKIAALKGEGVIPDNTKAAFEKQKKDAESKIAQLDVTDKDFNTKKAAQVKLIREAEAQLEKYNTTVKSTNKSTETANKLQADQNRLISDGKNLIEAITKAKESANETGLTDEALKLKNINDKYNELIESVDTYNKKVDEFNKKNPKKPVQKIGQTLINDLSDSRNRELTNFNLKIDADLFKESLDKKRALYEQFENAKLEIGIDKARELFDKELGQFTTFQKLLEDEAKKLAPKIAFGIANIGDVEKFKAVMAAIKELNEKQAQDDLDRQKQTFSELLQATVTFNTAKAAINKKYDDLENALRKDTTIKDKDEVLKLLKQRRQEEIDAIADDLAARLPEFQKLFGGIEQLSDAAAKKVIADAKAIIDALQAQGAISKEFADQVRKQIQQAEEALGARLPSRLRAVGDIFSQLSGSVRELNSDLADTLDTLSSVLNVASDISTAFAEFKKGTTEGDIAGVTSIVSAVSEIIKKIEDSIKSAKQVKQEALDFQTRLITGEQEYNALLRERQRQQVLLNKTAIKGFEDQKRLLLEQKKLAQDSFNAIFEQLQKESFIASQKVGSKKPGIFSGMIDLLFPKKELQSQLKSLAGKSFEEIEKLFATGQLTDKAKELFERLREIKQEGVDIDALLEQNRIKAQELFTGTTEQSIGDLILEGFKQGKRGIADFADTFEDLMRGAIFQALKFQALEEPLKAFFAEFAASAESDSILTDDEIKLLRERFNSIITDAGEKFEELERITNINLAGGDSSSQNSLTGAIKGMTEQTAQLLAGQMGGLRLTAIDQLLVSRSQLESLSRIQVNTALASERLMLIYERLHYYYEIRGVKVL